MADPLTPDPSAPPHEGLVPAAGPPRSLRALRVRVEAVRPGDVARALARLEPVLAGPGLRRALVQVHYRMETRHREAAAAHADFAARHRGLVSTWLPICLPGSPDFERLGGFATPPDCRACVFYQARACQGLGGEALPWAGLPAPPALQPVTGTAELAEADFAASTPAAYWMPEPAHLAAIGATVRAAGGRMWDLGGGNGLLAWRLARDEGLDVTVVDPVDAYPTPPGVRRHVGDVRTYDAAPPDALLISWPPTGDAFRDVVDRLRPAVVVYAYDSDGFCGRRRGYAGLVASAEALRWFRWPADDLRPIPGLPVRARWAVRSHHDLRAGGRARTGRLEIRAR